MKRHIVSFLIILVALVGLGYLIVRPESSQKLAQNSTAVSPLLTTDRWIGLNGYPGGISLRAVGGNPDPLLKHNNAEIIYRFSPADKQLRSVNADTWNNAQGEVIDSLLPFLGEGGASGTHYSQVFSYPGLVPIASAVELPFTTKRVTFRSCWSSEERFIVYSDAIDSQLSIVVLM